MTNEHNIGDTVVGNIYCVLLFILISPFLLIFGLFKLPYYLESEWEGKYRPQRWAKRYRAKNSRLIKFAKGQKEKGKSLLNVLDYMDKGISKSKAFKKAYKEAKAND